MADALASLDATAQAELVRRGKATPRELVDAAIARIEALNPQLNAVILPLFEEARRRAERPLPDGPFRGVPFLLKDLDVALAGTPNHCGMRFLKRIGHVSTKTSHLVERFLAAGLVPVGKTNTPELGLTVTTEPLAYGASRNPWNLGHSTGGSSGGSAAAVAAGLVPFAHASDGGGSIRIPASECGLVGLKPSRGRISLAPEYGEYWAGMVTNLVVSRTVRDTAAILDWTAGMVAGDPYATPPPRRPFAAELGASPGRLRIGVLAEIPGQPGVLHVDCIAAVQGAARTLESLGHAVEAAYPPALAEAEASAHFLTTMTSWVASALDEWQTVTGQTIDEAELEPGTRVYAGMGRQVSAAAYLAAQKSLSRWSRRMAAWWDEFDLLLTPTLGAPPPEIGWLVPSEDDPVSTLAKLAHLVPFTPPFNLSGQPAISLPLHWTAAGLPIGVQVVAAYAREDLLIAVASQLEDARPWRDRRPPIHA